MSHASDNWWMASLVLLFAAMIIGRILTARGGKAPTIRRIPGLNAVDEAIGRATEMGRPVMMVPGVGSIGDSNNTVPTLQAMSILGYIARAAAKFGNRVIVPTIDPVLTGIAEEVMRDAYQSAGRPELFQPGDVRYLSSGQFAYASGVAGLLSREKVAASFLFGSFYAESLILAEVGQRVGAIQIAGTEQRTQIPFFIAACDYVIIGDEFYAASAYLSRNPTLLGSIVAQDYCKLLLIAAVLIGVFCSTVLAFSQPGELAIHTLTGHVAHVHFGSIPSQVSTVLQALLKALTPSSRK
jgi:hypothetical protein